MVNIIWIMTVEKTLCEQHNYIQYHPGEISNIFTFHWHFIWEFLHFGSIMLWSKKKGQDINGFSIGSILKQFMRITDKLSPCDTQTLIPHLFYMIPQQQMWSNNYSLVCCITGKSAGYVPKKLTFFSLLNLSALPLKT